MLIWLLGRGPRDRVSGRACGGEVIRGDTARSHLDHLHVRSLQAAAGYVCFSSTKIAHVLCISGLKKLKELEGEIRRITTIRHVNLLAVLGAKLIIPRAPDNPRLVILTEQRPSVTLHDVLEDTDHLREDRTTVRICMIRHRLTEY